MMKNIIVPFFTVVIPLYNKEKYLRRCLDSVLNQSCSDFEIVIVDDGSTDSSRSIATSYSDSRIRLVQQPNAGVSAARNTGISEARSKWVAFLDADDEYLPSFLAEVSLCIEKYPEAGAVYADPIWFSKGEQLNKLAHRCNFAELIPDYFNYIVFRQGYEIHSSCVVVKKEIFSRAGRFPVGVKVGEDSDMWMRVAWTTSIAHIPKPLSIYHMDAGDSSWEEERLKEAYWVQTYRQWLAQGRIPENLLKSTDAYYQRYLLGKALRYVLIGDKPEARKLLFKCVSWQSAPKKYAFKVILYVFFPIVQLRTLFANRGH